jgi:lipoprotein-anchoring transpeptidase ErfK/SrfK
MRQRVQSLKYRIARLWKRRRNKVIFALACINILLIFLLYSNIFTYPNTFIGSTNVSGKTAEQIREILDKEQSVLPKIQIKDRTYQYTYNQLGVVVDKNRALSDAFDPNRKFFPINLMYFIRSSFTKNTIPAPVVFTQAFDQFVSDMTFNFGNTPDGVSVDPETKSIVVAENSEAYRFDKESLQTLISTRFGDYTHPIYPLLNKVTNETINQVTDVNQKLSDVFSRPIMVYLDMGGTTEAVELKEEDIREATTITIAPVTLSDSISVNPADLNRVLTRRIHASGIPIRDNIVTPNVQNDFLKAIQLRYAGVDISAVSTKPDDGPNTDGSIAEKYIEVDISQQKMYLFKDGVVYKTYKVSTGLDYPTPVGQFTILNKVDLGFSDIYKVWLPWWLGFSYSDKLQAYFGIHEQPYTLTADGKPVIRDQRLGTPSTGGCIALAPGAAEEVYSFATIAMPVYIYN